MPQQIPVTDDFTPILPRNVRAGFERRQAEWLKEPDRHRRKILLNYNLHAALELSGRCEEIFHPELTVAEPRYEYFQAGIVYDGAAAVGGFYGVLTNNNATAIVASGSKIAVADWGFSVEQTSHYHMEYDLASKNGLPAKPGRFYVWHRPLAMVWHYDSHARLVGERVYHAAHSSYSEVPVESYLHTNVLREELALFVDRAWNDYRSV